MNDLSPLFPLGPIVATAGAVAEVPILAIHAALDRHANERALAGGGRLLSAYETPGGGAFWIVTEWDRSLTTVLLPEDCRPSGGPFGSPFSRSAWEGGATSRSMPLLRMP